MFGRSIPKALALVIYRHRTPNGVREPLFLNGDYKHCTPAGVRSGCIRWQPGIGLPHRHELPVVGPPLSDLH